MTVEEEWGNLKAAADTCPFISLGNEGKKRLRRWSRSTDIIQKKIG